MLCSTYEKKMAVNDVCRLCLATDDLVYIFDEENKKLKISDVISITTGIEVGYVDRVVYEVCSIISVIRFRFVETMFVNRI